jgi:Fe-Mn family superoxide dismutase
MDKKQTPYVLPELAYDYGALEPYISGHIMELHHDKHHRGYVEGANRTLEQLQEARTQGKFDNVSALEQVLAFDASGHLLHSLFWQNLAPRAGGEPSGALGKAIQRDFGGFEAFKRQLAQTAATIMGSGWAALLWDPLSEQLMVVQLHDHQSRTIQGAVPVLVLDVWEHAYYLQYETAKAKYIEAVWNLWNWAAIGERYDTIIRSPNAAARL